MSGRERIGILGGTFDPIHNGHLLLAQQAAQVAHLDRVLLVVAKDPPHKQPDVPAAHRLEMVRLAAQEAGRPLEACDLELKLPGKGYAVEVVGALAQQHPQADLFYLAGSDLLPTLPYWKGSRELLRLARVLCVPRRGWSLDAGTFQRLVQLCGGRVQLLEISLPEVSSSQLRQRLRMGEPVEGMLPAPVLAHIREHGLYQWGRL